jgi:hypothetical protein
VNKVCDSPFPIFNINLPEFSFSAVPSNPPTHEHVSRQRQHRIGRYITKSTKGRLWPPVAQEDEVLFDVNGWIAHQNLFPVEKAASGATNSNTVSGMGFLNRSGTISSGPPNPFTATHFEPRINAKPWLRMVSREITRDPIKIPIILDPDPECWRPRKLPSGAGRDDLARQVTRSDAVKGKGSEVHSSQGQSAIIATLPPLTRKRIPWKGKFIVVKLPPPLLPKPPNLLP